ncbi:unnamed protein product, partial [Ectocarpus sp. 13 AM-2016]
QNRRVDVSKNARRPSPAEQRAMPAVGFRSATTIPVKALVADPLRGMGGMGGGGDGGGGGGGGGGGRLQPFLQPRSPADRVMPAFFDPRLVSLSSHCPGID